MTNNSTKPRCRKVAQLSVAAAVIRALALAALAAIPCLAQNRFILETGSAADLSRVADQYDLTVVHPVSAFGSVYVVSAGQNAPADLAARLRTVPGVVEIESDRDLSVTDERARPQLWGPPQSLLGYLSDRSPVNYYGALVRSGYVQQPATGIIGMAQAHAGFPPGGGIVAVIDTGVDPAHPVLANSLVPGYDFIRDKPGYASELADLSQSTVAILDQSTVAILDSKNWPVVLNQSTVAILDQSTVAILDGTKLPEDFGHGTMVSGLIHLVAPRAMIMPLKAFKADGTGKLSDVIRAIYYAADHNATVINMSFSVADPSPDLLRAIDYAASRGVICVASAGNSGHKMRVYPAGFTGVIGVGSTSNADTLSRFSNYGDGIRFGAPGEALITLYPGGNYAAVWGTSFSAPLVAGAASLMSTVAPGMTYAYILDGLSQGPEVADFDARLDLAKSLAYCAYRNQGGGN